MIPNRVTMKGWMRYREEQVADFSGARLIAVCGDNGAGKSSIFDAITYALFGTHRLGKQRVAELISEDLEHLTISLEFEADGLRYKIERNAARGSRGRGSGFSFWDEDVNGWRPVPGAEKAAALQQSIDRVIRLTPETFTASFMLQQGAVTVFLDAEPRDRFDIVSSLIGLKEYEALEDRARRQQQVEKDHVKRLTEELATFADATDDALVCAQEASTEANARHAAAETRRAEAQVVARDTERHTALAEEIAALDSRIATADALIRQQAQIEADAARFAQIPAQLGAVARVRDALAAAAVADTEAAAARTQAAALDVAALEAASTRADQRIADAEAALTDRERTLDAARIAERVAADFAALAARVTKTRAELAQLDQLLACELDALAELPAIADHIAANELIDNLLHPLKMYITAHLNLAALEAEQPAATLADLSGRQQALEQTHRTALAERDVCALRRREAGDAAAHATTTARHLAALVAEREHGVGDATCRRCGQPVDGARAARELADLRAQADTARAAERAAAAALAAATDALSTSTRAVEGLVAEQAALTGEVVRAEARVRDLTRARTDAGKLRTEFLALRPPSSLIQEVDGATTAAEFKSVYNRQYQARECLPDLRERRAKLSNLEGQVSKSRQQRAVTADALATLEREAQHRLADVPRAATLLAEANAALVGAMAATTDARRLMVEARTAADVARRTREDAQQRQRARLEAAAQFAQTAAGHRQAAQAHAEPFSDTLRAAMFADPAATLHALEAERARLLDAPTRIAELRDALREHDQLTGARAVKRADIERIPVAHRLPVEAAVAALAQAEAELRSASAARSAADAAAQRLAHRLEQVRQMTDERATAMIRQQRFAKLTKLLGREGIQGTLVMEALTSITAHANAFLERLTGGTLRLTLEQSKGDELELRALDVTCMHEPRSVKALSGSQKFRCAVAVASGIGQYAGAGGMRSIVIDEGFGSLDAGSQSLMIEELKHLAGYMDRVIVVSHLEAFTNRDHFPDQIVVERVGNASRILSNA